MAGDAEAPGLNRFAVIIDRDSTVLAAVISSYLFESTSYLPLFLFPRVLVSQTEDAAPMSQGYMANLMGHEAAVFIHNALVRMTECECVVLAGLNEHQKSFLLPPDGLKILSVTTMTDVHRELSPLTLPHRGELRCRASDVLGGLYIAQKRRKTLVIDENAGPLPEVVELRKGIVVIENVADASGAVAVNYASSIGASVLIVSALDKNAGRDIQGWVQDWKENNDSAQLHKLRAEILTRTNSVPFARFDYATFFTEGLPYSLVLENIIPCTHVHLSLKPDLFVFNNIRLSDGNRFRAAIVFSPVFFPDEETAWLCKFFDSSRYYLRSLVGGQATLANLDFHAQHFPYDLLHICSHGGEVDGYEMSEQFVDEDGDMHLVEFDEVIGVTPAPDKPGFLVVHRKAFPRKLDGIPWMSEELEKLNLASHVYHGMWKCVLESRGQRRSKGRVAKSCAIACSDSIHQGEFHMLASHTSPIVFNNSCWSAHDVASFFLACGARSYIGTLWAIDNQAAVIAARIFYENLFFGSILAAHHSAVKAIEATESKDIYVYWGLHFTTLSPGHSPQASKNQVREELIHAAKAWLRKIESTKSQEIRANSVRALRSILQELNANFGSDEVRRLGTEVGGEYLNGPQLASLGRRPNLKSLRAYHSWNIPSYTERREKQRWKHRRKLYRPLGTPYPTSLGLLKQADHRRSPSPDFRCNLFPRRRLMGRTVDHSARFQVQGLYDTLSNAAGGHCNGVCAECGPVHSIKPSDVVRSLADLSAHSG